jgi:hypothetical protein
MAADLPRAKALGEEIVELARGAGETWYLALGLCNLGVAERELGSFERAREVLLECEAIAADVGDLHLLAVTLCNAAHVERKLGDTDAAGERFVRALQLVRDDPVPEVVIWCLDGLAATEVPSGDPERGAVFLGAAEELMASTSYNHPQTRAELEQTRESIERTLGAERTADARSRGADADLGEVVAQAIAERLRP